MQKIVPNLWFDGRVEDAVAFYTSVFAQSKTGRVDHYTEAGKEIHGHTPGDIVSAIFTVEDMDFLIINGGPNFVPNPSISFSVHTTDKDEIIHLWESLSDGGATLMALDAYPFSELYGWLNDKYGISWQLVLVPTAETQKIIPSLLFTGHSAGKAEEAMNFYTSLFPYSELTSLDRYPAGVEPEVEDTIRHGEFTLFGEQFIAMDSARDHNFSFNEAVSLMLTVDTQEEIDRYWEQLSAVPEAEICGWLKDVYGVSWQIVPSLMNDMQENGTPEQIERVTSAFMQMGKLDIATLQAAYSQ